MDQKPCQTSRRVHCDRSRYRSRNRRGYTLRSGSGCLTIGPTSNTLNESASFTTRTTIELAEGSNHKFAVVRNVTVGCVTTLDPPTTSGLLSCLTQDPSTTNTNEALIQIDALLIRGPPKNARTPYLIQSAAAHDCSEVRASGGLDEKPARHV